MATTCTRCGSDKIIEDAKIEDRVSMDRRVALEVLIGYRSTGGMRADQPQRFPLTARICGNCGFTEMFVSDPARLWRASQRLTRKG